MQNIPHELKYNESHEWVRENEDGTYSIGISDHAQSLLGDIVYVELPQIGDDIGAGQECAMIESVKAASDIYAPVSGEVVAINENLEESPELINSDPYHEGYLFTLNAADSSELDKLLDADAYATLISEQED